MSPRVWLFVVGGLVVACAVGVVYALALLDDNGWPT